MGLATDEGSANDTYRPLLAQLPGGQITLEEAYNCMDKIMKEVRDCWFEKEFIFVFSQLFLATVPWSDLH